MPESLPARKAEAFPRTTEERALLAATEALTAAAQKAHAEGDQLVAEYLYDRSRESLDRLKQVQRILAEPSAVLAVVG